MYVHDCERISSIPASARVITPLPTGEQGPKQNGLSNSLINAHVSGCCALPEPRGQRPLTSSARAAARSSGLRPHQWAPPTSLMQPPPRPGLGTCSRPHIRPPTILSHCRPRCKGRPTNCSGNAINAGHTGRGGLGLGPRPDQVRTPPALTNTPRTQSSVHAALHAAGDDALQGADCKLLQHRGVR